MGWLNADDLHAPWTLALVGELFERFPQVEWLTTQYPLIFDEAGRCVQTGYGGGFNADAFRRGANLPGRGWFATGFVQQESTFWRRSLWERAGGRVDASLQLAGDFELWAASSTTRRSTRWRRRIAGFRRHGDAEDGGRASRPTSPRRKRVLRARGWRPYGADRERLPPRDLDRLRRAAAGAHAARLGAPLAAARVIRPAPVLAWKDGWRIATDYVV